MKSHRLPSQSVNILRSRNWTESLSFKCDDQCCFRSHSFFLSLVSNIVLFLLCALSKDALQLRENMRSDNISLTITINIFGPGTNGVTRVLRRKTDIILQINNLLREIFSICSNLAHFTPHVYKHLKCVPNWKSVEVFDGDTMRIYQMEFSMVWMSTKPNLIRNVDTCGS